MCDDLAKIMVRQWLPVITRDWRTVPSASRKPLGILTLMIRQLGNRHGAVQHVRFLLSRQPCNVSLSGIHEGCVGPSPQSDQSLSPRKEVPHEQDGSGP